MCIGEVKKTWKNLISVKFFLKKSKKIKKLRFRYWNSHKTCGLEIDINKKIDIDIDIDIYICFKFFLIYILFVLEKVLQ